MIGILNIHFIYTDFLFFISYEPTKKFVYKITSKLSKKSPIYFKKMKNKKPWNRICYYVFYLSTEV